MFLYAQSFILSNIFFYYKFHNYFHEKFNLFIMKTFTINNFKNKKISYLIGVLLCSLSGFSQITFYQHEITDEFTQGTDVFVYDINDDNHKDIVAVAKRNSGEVCWWENDGFGNFTEHSIRQGFNGARSVRAADINHDNKTDIIAAAWINNDIIWWENDGDENFTEHIIDDNFVGAHTVDIKDVNDDGHNDVLCSGFDYYGHEGEIAWWENDGEGNFIKHLISTRFQQSPFIYGEDMDDDGDLDVIACGELNDEVLWWENDGNENFTEHLIDDSFDAAHTVIAKDIDKDDDMDILGAACMSGTIAWWENNGNQDFTKHNLGSFPGALWLDATDIDKDNDIDLIGAGMGSSRLAWWENDGNQDFTKNYFQENFISAFCISIADVDNDTDDDIVAIGYYSNKISWFENSLVNPNYLNNPESVVYDSVYKRYLVSNWEDGNIIQIDIDEQQDYFNTELSSTAGLHIVGDTVFVSSNEGEYSGIVGMLLSSGRIVFYVNIPDKQLLNDITSDLTGNLYVTDCEANKIFKIRINDQSYTTFVDSGLGYPNGIILDQPNDRLLVLNGLLPYKPIISVNLEDSTISTVVETNISSIDGLTSDNYGNIYFSSWTTDNVYRYDESFTNPPEIVSSGHTNPADIFFNKLDDILAIPNFNANSVDFIQIIFTGNEENKENNIKINSLFPNPFSNQVNLNFYLPEKALTKIFVYDILGNKIIELKNEELNRGEHLISWKGEGKNNCILDPGIYFIHIIAEKHLQTFKIVKY